MNISKEFIKALDSVYEQIGDKEIAQAKKCFIDFVAVCISGEKHINAGLSKSTDLFSGISPVLGAKQNLNIFAAIFRNSYSAHLLELDDGHRAAMLHLAAPIFPALLGCVEMQPNVSFQQLLKASVIGYEAAIRIARTIQPEHKKNGFHATGTCGTIGVAIACAYFLNYDFEGKLNVLSAASTSASGILEVIMGESQQKPYNAAHASVSGFTAAIFGHSLTAPSDPLYGPRGFINNFVSKPKLENLTIKAPAEILSIYFKPYAACRHCHAPIEAGLKMHENIEASDIDSVEVKTYDLAVYGHEHTDIDSVNSAKMSIPYTLACALVLGQAGMDIFDINLINDPKIRELTKKIKILEDKNLSKLVPSKRVAIVNVTLKSGEKLTKRVDYPLGEPENPISDEALSEKFISLLNSAGYCHNTAKSLIDEIEAFPLKNNVTLLIKKIVEVKPA